MQATETVIDKTQKVMTRLSPTVYRPTLLPLLEWGLFRNTSYNSVFLSLFHVITQ